MFVPGSAGIRWVAALVVLLILAPMAAIVLVGIGATLSRTGLDALDLLVWKLRRRRPPRGAGQA